MIELSNGVFLMALESPSSISTNLKEDLSQYNIIFKGDLQLLMEFSEKYVEEVYDKKFKDYYYHSSGFPVATMSLQSAIWAAEQKHSKQNNSTYFIILEK